MTQQVCAPLLQQTTRMKIAGVASALPPHRYEQGAITAALASLWRGKLENPALLERLHSRTGVEARHLAFPLQRYAEFSSWGETNAAWLEVAEQLGAAAIDAALDNAGLARDDLDALYVVSITGVASPSLDARLVNRLQLRRDIKRTPIFGIGCAGGAIGLTRAADYTLAYPGHCAALLAVEGLLPHAATGRSLHGEFDLERIVRRRCRRGGGGGGGKGARAAGLGRGPLGADDPRQQLHLLPQLGRRHGLGHLRERLSHRAVAAPAGGDQEQSRSRCRHVPEQARPHARRHRMLGHSYRRAEGAAGDPAHAGLGERDLERSWDCLRRFGNLSSASVLLVLEDAAGNHAPVPGTLGLLLAMGPGFCSELILLQW